MSSMTEPIKKKKVAILQSNYIPWRGYFDLIHDVDEFIFYDDVQYTKNDWRNRNRIKTPYGTKWITIPVGAHNDKLICEIEFRDHTWTVQHWDIFRQYYSKAAYFKQYEDFFKNIYFGIQWKSLSELNQYMIKQISTELLGITTLFKDSRSFKVNGVKQERLIQLLTKTEANIYISGPAAKAYIDDADFQQAGIQLIYKEYPDYPDYNQFHPPFDPFVSIIDLIFHTGPEAPYYIWGWRS